MNRDSNAIRSMLVRVPETNDRSLGFFWFAVLAAFCAYAAFLVRFRLHVPSMVREAFWITLSGMSLAKCLTGWATGIWNRPLDSTNANDIHRVFLAAGLAGGLTLLLNITLFRALDVSIPRTVILLDGLLTIAALSFLRVMSLQEGAESAQVTPSWWRSGLTLAGVFCLAIAFVFCRLGFDEHLTEWFDGDALYLGHLVQDVFYDGNAFSGWLFPPAPFLFPDLGFAFIARLLTPQPALGMFLTGAFLFAFVTLAACYASALVSKNSKTAISLTVASSVFVLLAIGMQGTSSAFRYLMFPAFHTGTYGLSLLLIAMGIHFAVDDGVKRTWLLFGLGILAFGAGFSDLMTIAYVTAPLCVAMGIGWLLKLVPLRRAFLVSAVISAAPLLGHWCCLNTLRLKPDGLRMTITLESMVQGSRRFLDGFLQSVLEKHVTTLAAAVWILGCWIVLGIWVLRRMHASNANASSVRSRRKVLFVTTLSLAGLATICSLIAGGNYELLNNGYHVIQRYLHPFVYTPFLFWPMLLPESLLRKLALAFPRRTVLEFQLGACGILIGTILSLGLGPRPLHAYAPEYVPKLDAILVERGLKQGISYYWVARHVNVFGNEGIQVFTVRPDLEYAYLDWMNNKSWLKTNTGGEETDWPRPEFVILTPDPIYSRKDPNAACRREHVIRRFGEPAEEIVVDHERGFPTVLIYNRAEDHKLHGLFSAPKAFWSNGFTSLEFLPSDDSITWRWCGPRGDLTLTNPLNESVAVTISFTCVMALSDEATVKMDSSLIKKTFSASRTGTPIQETITLPPGEHLLKFTSNGTALEPPGDSRKLVFQVRDFAMKTIGSEERDRLAVQDVSSRDR